MSGEATRIWYDPATEDAAHFRTGRACWVTPSPDRPFDESIAEFPFSANVYWGIIFLKLAEQLEHLPSNNLPIGQYEEAVLLPAGLVEAAEILRGAASQVSPGFVDFQTMSGADRREPQYWIQIDFAALKIALDDLARFVEDAAKRGFGVQFWL